MTNRDRPLPATPSLTRDMANSTDNSTDADRNHVGSQPRSKTSTQDSSSNVVVIYTDGGCIGNPGPGGWAAILQYGSHRKEISGRFRDTTNNRMELWAAIAALEALTRPCAVDLYTDSSYVRDGITKWVKGWKKNGWRTANKQPVKNRDLWERLLHALERHQAIATVNWHWVKGHAGNPLNEQVDQLANTAARTVTDGDPVDEAG